MSTNKKTMSIEEKIFQLAEAKTFDDVSDWWKASKYEEIVTDILEMMKISEDYNIIFRNKSISKRIKFKHLELGYVGTIFIVYFDGKPFTFQIQCMTNERTISTESFLCDKKCFMKAYDFLQKQIKEIVNDDVSLYSDYGEENSFEQRNQQLKIVGDELRLVNTDDNTFVVCS